MRNAMTVDSLTPQYQDKRLRLEFNDGEIAEVRLLLLSQCDEHEECRGITYDLISTNRPNRAKDGSACWANLPDIKSFEVIGDLPS
jgi:hypothetical protein